MSENQRIIAGRYQLGNLIGRGGMADVYEGTDTRLGRVVAVKLLKSDLANDPNFEARFRQEAQASARMAHPTIVRIYDAGEDAVTDLNGNAIRRPYIVMEYVRGQVLRDLLHNRRLTIEEAVDYTDEVLTALSISHAAGIVHRDIKSANIMITDAGHVKVMDFGIARAVSESANTQAYSVGIVGTAQYFSPEQARGESVDARTDLYSTGVLLYEMLAGRPPFAGETAVSVAYQHVSEAVTPPSVHNPMVSPELDAVVLQAMAKDRGERYQSADDFRNHLAAAVSASRGVGFSAPVTSGMGPSVDASADASAAQPTEVMSDFDKLLQGDSPFESNETAEPTTVQDEVEYVYTHSQPVVLPPSVNPDATERADTSLITNPFAALGIDAPPVTASSAVLDTSTTAVRVRARARTGAPSPRVIWGVGSGLSVLLVGLLVWFIAIGGLPSFTINPSPTAGIAVPNLANQTYTDGAAALDKLQLVPSKAYQQSDTVPADSIISTDPAAGTLVAPDQVITVYVSSGKGQVQVPNLLGLTEDAANQALTAAKLSLGSIVTVNSANIPAGQIVSSSPASGTQVTAGTPINLNVSNGQVLVPDVVGLDQTTAQQRLTAKDVGLTVSFASPTNCSAGVSTNVASQSLVGLVAQLQNVELTLACN